MNSQTFIEDQSESPTELTQTTDVAVASISGLFGNPTTPSLQEIRDTPYRLDGIDDSLAYDHEEMQLRESIVNLMILCLRYWEETTKKDDSKDVKWSNKKGETGPENWAKLPMENNACGGKVQSPIDIVTKDAKKGEDLSAFKFAYGESDANIVNNGHTIQFNSINRSRNS